MEELEKLIEELIFPFKNAPVVTLEGQEPITIDAKKLDETLDKAFRLGQESVKQTVEEARKEERGKVRKLISKKFPVGERQWCVQCVEKIYKELNQ